MKGYKRLTEEHINDAEFCSGCSFDDDVCRYILSNTKLTEEYYIEQAEKELAEEGKMGQQTIPTDEQNICLKCAHSVYTEGNKIKPDGYDYFYTMCGCWLCLKGKNVGHRKTCSNFLESEEKEI